MGHFCLDCAKRETCKVMCKELKARLGGTCRSVSSVSMGRRDSRRGKGAGRPMIQLAGSLNDLAKLELTGKFRV